MMFGEKINLSQEIIHKHQPMLGLYTMGPTEEEYNYRNKSVYSFNLEKNLLDQVSFQIIGLEHSKMIQYLNIKNRKYHIVSKNNYGIKDIFIKNNWKQEYQICLCVYSLADEFQDRLTKYLFMVIKSIVKDLSINIVSAYYHLYNKKIPLKDREMKLFYGVEKLEEKLSIQLLGGEKNISIWLSPHSFSRVNYQNSQIIYQKVWDTCYSLSLENSYQYIMFGRDLYYPLKILLDLPRKSGFLGITHCPITYRDVISDRENELGSMCQFVEKSRYVAEITRHINSKLVSDYPEYVFVLTAGRNGLGKSLCQMLVELKQKERVRMIMYIGCNRQNMDADMTRLVGMGKYQITKAFISNEFSLTNYNNNILVLE